VTWAGSEGGPDSLASDLLGFAVIVAS
jgi:hypothetical protein